MPSIKLPRPEFRLPNLYEGITLVGVIGAAFWLGTMSISLKQNSDKLDKLYGAVLESKDSLNARTSVIESKLDAINEKIQIDKKLEELKKLEERLRQGTHESSLERAVPHAQGMTGE
jgi:hypothetical protein